MCLKLRSNEYEFISLLVFVDIHVNFSGYGEAPSGIPKVKMVKCVAVSAPVHIHNAHIKGTQQKSMVKPALRVEGYTSWTIRSIACF